MASAQLITHKLFKSTLLTARAGKGAVLALPLLQPLRLQGQTHSILFPLFLSFLLLMRFLMSM